ncbi:AIM32 [Candida oxycetoniae]|uniref:Altered inheritance of mitochondria protein 32 n=1 Tax=Candida oxycetoniae TaxID=497107 RepID=A0AAI9WW41_9ASCO|nr:AIM32 [Candida oxycetoniae]KAI3402347.2 AIM32 [Candida oxycetoniae]
MIRLLRSLSTLSPRSAEIQWRLVESVPAPTYNTGCTFCQPTFPPDKQINFDQNLNKSSRIPAKHVMVLTTKDNKMEHFESKIENWKGTLSNEIGKLKHKVPIAEGTSVSSIVLQNHDTVLQEEFGINHYSNPQHQLVFLYPDMKAIKFDIMYTDQFITKYIPQTQKTTVFNPFKKKRVEEEEEEEEEMRKPAQEINVDDANFQETMIDKDLIVTCGHAKRDIRCGLLGPLITNEFDKVLRKEGIRDDSYVGEITHIGGHAFAGNVLYYPKQCKSNHDFIWYGRVFPKDVQGLVEETVKNKKIIQRLFRGDLSKYQ